MLPLISLSEHIFFLNAELVILSIFLLTKRRAMHFRIITQMIKKARKIGKECKKPA